MGGNGRDPAGVIRRLIDFGPDEGTMNPLPVPWDAFRAVVLAAGGSRQARIQVLYDVLEGLPNRAEVVWRINQADMTTEPPFLYADYPEVFEADLAVVDLYAWSQGVKKKGDNSSCDKNVGVSAEFAAHAPPERGNMAVASTDTRRMVRVKACEAFQPRPPTNWLVEGVLSESSLNLLVGEGGSKKTYSMLDLAVCLVTGQPWLGYATRQCPVLWVDEESGPDRMNHRLAQVMRAHEARRDIPLEYLSVCQFNLRQPDDLNLFFQHVFEMGAGLVVVDALADVMPGADENSVKDVVPVFRGLRGVAVSTGAAVLVIHHANKSGGYRGSSHMRGAVELMLMAQSKADSRFIEFQSVKTRDTGSIHFAAQIHFEPEGGEAERVWLSPAGTTEAGVANRAGEPLSDAEKYVMGYLLEFGESERKEIIESTHQFSEGYFKKAFSELTRSGLIRRTNKGGKGIPAVYELTETGEEVY
jgi:hypothetical protein